MQLHVLDDIVQTVGAIHRICRIIARHDPDLSRQMKRAINSVGLDSGKGISARGGNRTLRIESAMDPRRGLSAELSPRRPPASRPAA